MTKTEIDKETVKEVEEYLPLKLKEVHPAYVNVTAGATINLGNYSSGKVSVSITYPCDLDKVDATYEKLKNWVDKRVEAEVLELKSVSDSPSKGII